MAWYDPITSLFQKDEPSAAPPPSRPSPPRPMLPPGAEGASGSVPMMDPIGTTGLRRAGGFVDEELLRKLSGRKAALVFREMSDNSPIVGAVLYVVQMLLRQAEWRTEPAGESPRQKEAAEFLEQCFEDMAHTWDEMMAEILSMLPFGWAFLEIVLKVRCGPGDDPKRASKFSDHRIGIRKVSIRAQDTLDRWEFNDEGEVIGLWQQDPWAGNRGCVFIPLNRALLFRTTSHKNNPEGRSMLRNAYRPWFFGKRIEEIEAIGIERDLTGLPIVEVPAELMAPNATAAQKQLRAAFERLVQQVRRDEREGVVMPSSTNSEGKSTGYSFKLMGSGGRRAIDTSAVVTRHEQRIAMTMLAEFLFLGTQAVGSYSLASTKTSLFTMALGGIMENIGSTLNRQLVPKIMALNGYATEDHPKVVYGDLESPPLEGVAGFINQPVQAGALVPDAKLERKLREMAKLPQIDEDHAMPAPRPVSPAPVVPDAPPAAAPAPAAAAPTFGPDDTPDPEGGAGLPLP